MQDGTITSGLIQEITEQHNIAVAGVNAAAEAYWHCGRLLKDAKKSAGEGNFTLWVEFNCPFTLRTAENYMAFHTKHVSGPPVDLERVKLVDNRERQEIEGDVKLGVALPTYSKADNVVSKTFERWKHLGCPEPVQMLKTIDGTIQLLTRQRDEVRSIMLAVK